MNHINAVIDDFDASVAHFQEVYGAQFLCDLPNPAWHACLIAIAGVIFELFAPNDELLHGRVGPHYIGVEYQVPDVAAAREHVQAKNIRIIRDSGVSFHTHPADCFGVAFEFFEESFHDDPPPTPYLEPISPAPDDHLLGCLGLERYVIAVEDLDAAVTFLQELTDASVQHAARLSSPRNPAVELMLGDTRLELNSPEVGTRPWDQLARYGDGIQSCIFGVRDLDRAAAYFASLDLPLEENGRPGLLQISAAHNRGLAFSFCEGQT